MQSLLTSFSGMAESTVVPMFLNYIQTNEQYLEDAIVNELGKLRTSNPQHFNSFITNWKKMNHAIERSIANPVPPPVIPPPVPAPVSPPPPVAGSQKRRYRKKRTHTVKHRRH